MKKQLFEFCRLKPVVSAFAVLAVMWGPPLLANGGEVPAMVGDRVWEDLNKNGIQDCQDTNNNSIIGDIDPSAPSDPNKSDQGPECGSGVPNIEVNLYRVDSEDACVPGVGAVTETMQTDADGFYKFTRYPPNDGEKLCVEFIPPPVCVFTKQNVGDDVFDSDANTVTGFSDAVMLEPDDDDRTVDAGLICEEEDPPMLGDRVWEDMNVNGRQDCRDTNGDGILGNDGDTGPECDSGIADVPVMLTGPGPDNICNTDDDSGVMQQQPTDSNGFYKFNVKPGVYCVMVGKPPRDFCRRDDYDLGDPQFTLQDAVNDFRDSDVDPVTGKTGNIPIETGDDDRTNDAGIYCPAKIGDRVWKDTNQDGIQDDGEAGVGGVEVNLYECGPNGFPGGGDDIKIGTRTTDGTDNGMYMFGAEDNFELDPGNYYVEFIKPDGTEFTIPNINGDARNSDCLPPKGITQCTRLNSGSINLRRDCGIVETPENCDLVLDQKCRVEPKPPTPDFDKCDGKLQQFSVIWDGLGDIVVNGLGKSNLAVAKGDEVTFTGPFSVNDAEISVSGTANGNSVFHMSCSDNDFNDPSDCGKLAGNGKKDDKGSVNDWRLEGFIDKEGRVLDCSPPSNDGEFTDSCQITFTSAPSCDTIKDPKTLTWRYDGGTNGDGDCATSTFATAVNDEGKPHKDFKCSGSVDVTQAVTVDPEKGDNILVSPGAEFTTSRDGSKKLALFNTSGGGGTQKIEIHTSCSQPIQAGLTAGALTLVAVDGQRAESKVTYQYELTNLGDPVFKVNVVDNQLGNIAGPLNIGTGGSETFTQMANLDGTTVSTTVASGMLASGVLCQASDEVIVKEIIPPTPPRPITCKDIKDINSVELIWNGPGPINVQNGSQSILGINTGDPVSLQTPDKNTVVSISGAVNGTSEFHVSCSDRGMDGNDDCGKPQGNGKDDKSGLINDWLLDGMTGEKGQFRCL